MPIERVVRRAVTADTGDCVRIVTELPGHFTPDVPDKVRAELAERDGWVLTDGGEVTGFAVVARKYPETAEITWAAVAAGRHGAGRGTALIERVLAELAAAGVRLVEVKTLDPGAQYEPYVATYAFWLARGFRQLDVIDPLPDWGPGSPAAILVTALSTSE